MSISFAFNKSAFNPWISILTNQYFPKKENIDGSKHKDFTRSYNNHHAEYIVAFGSVVWG